VAFLAYALSVTLRRRLAPCAPGLTPRACWKNGYGSDAMMCPAYHRRRWLIMPRYTQPEPEQMLLLTNSTWHCRRNLRRESSRGDRHRPPGAS